MALKLLTVAIAAASIASASALSPMAHAAPRPGGAPAGPGFAALSSSGNWVLSSPGMRVSVSRKTGQIVSISTGGERLTAPADVLFTDKVTGRQYGAANGSTAVGKPRVTATEASLTIKRALSPDYAETIDLTLNRDGMRLDVEVTTTLGTDREAVIDYVVPALAKADEAFWASPGTPLKVANKGLYEVVYRTNTYLPWVALYDGKADWGLSLIEPPDVPKPGLTMRVDGLAKSPAVVFSNHHLRLGRNRSARATLCFVPHAGDWRPGLGWLAAKYTGYFRPVSKRVRDGEGWYAIGSPALDEPIMKEDASRKVTWQELHGHFPFYGVYLPDMPAWPVAMDQDAVVLDRWEKRDAPGMYVNSYDNMRRKMALWHKYGVQTYIYYQTFEAWHQYAEKYFAPEIARDADGRPCMAWQFCNLMNPDPATPWGKHILGQLDRIVETYPDVDGIFLDRDDYRDYDFSHDDGLSMQDSRPCYMLGFAQEKALVGIASRLHPRDKGIWTNGPTSLEVCKGVDGIMSEAVDPAANLMRLLGVERPMICLPYDLDPRATEVKLKTCLSGSYFPAITDLGAGTPSRAMEAKYAPLFALTKGRKWVLTAHAVTAPEGMEGNLLRATNGDYLATVVGAKATQVVLPGSAPALLRSVPVRVRVADAAAIRHCYLLSGDYVGVSELPFERLGNTLTARIPVQFAASMLVFTPAKRFDVTIQTEPVLLRGSANRIVLRGADADDAKLRTPWGELAVKAVKSSKLGECEAIAEVPADAAKGEAKLSVASGGTNTELSVWVVDPVEARAGDRVFLREQAGEDVPVEVTNYSNSPQTVSLAGAFVEGAGAVTVAEPAITLQPRSSRTVRVRMAAESAEGRVRFRVTYGGRTTTSDASVGAVTRFAADDLFHDDFSSGDMGKWTVQSGKWTVKDGAARATGVTQFATTGDPKWSDYSFEATSKMDGSAQPSITWLKTYLFFRVQGPARFYRFGLHGDGGILELAKCVDGNWTTVATVPADISKGAWVTLRVEAKGADIRCFADGRQVLQVKDATFATGGIGIGVLENDMVNTYRHAVVKRAE